MPDEWRIQPMSGIFAARAIHWRFSAAHTNSVAAGRGGA
jgi:hypothetical protein